MLSWYNVIEVIFMTISKDNTRTQLTINKDLKKQLEKLAIEDSRSFNNLVIIILENFVKSTEK